MRGRLLGVLIALSLALNLAFAVTWGTYRFAAIASSRQPDENASGRQAGIWCPLHRELGLSPQQWEQIEPVLRALQEQGQALHRELSQERDQMIGLLAAAEVDWNAVRRRQETILEGHRRMQDMVLEQLVAEKEVLDDEQGAKLFGLLRQRAACAAGGPPMMGAGRRRERGASAMPQQTTRREAEE